MWHTQLATWVAGIWDRLRTSFWFLPAIMASAAVGLSFLLVKFDVLVGSQVIRQFGFLYEFGPEGARAVLSAISSSMITVAGLTFSITMLTLQLASSQFGPRLLRSFMRDRGNQLVLGTFTSTFLYCLLVLRTVRGTEGASFVPHLSVAFGVLLAALSLAVLIYFIHHVANSIRIETVLSELAAETRAAIDRLYPDQLGRNPSSSGVTFSDLAPDQKPIRACRSGYVQRVDENALMQIAKAENLVIRVRARPGCFVTEDEALLLAASPEPVSDRTADALRSAVVIGSERTPVQDLHFSLRRFVEIAQRALSPGTNDPTTALYCIDRLGEALCLLAEREVPSPVRVDDQDQPRVLTFANTLGDLACPAIASIARYAQQDADVVHHLYAMAKAVAKRARPEDAKPILDLAKAIVDDWRSKVSEFDKQSLDVEGPFSR